jgi:hypothetical protein
MCASAHVPVHGEGGEGGTDREGPRRREREKERTGQRLGAWQTGPARQRGKRGARAKKPTPIAWPHWAASEREGTRERELPLTGGSHLSGSTGARPGWAELGRLGRWAAVTPDFRRQTECEPCMCQDQQFMYTTVT